MLQEEEFARKSYNLDLFNAYLIQYLCQDKRDSVDTADLNDSCFDPCRTNEETGKNQCSDITNAESTCKKINKGIYTTDYHCQCKDNYDWNIVLKTCQVVSHFCSRSYNEGGCFREGLILEGKDCLEPNEDPNDTSEIMCYCNAQYGGRLCDRKKNACEEKIRPEFVAGKVACGDYEGRGECQLRESSDIGYFCKCASNRASDAGVGYPNCYQLTDACSKNQVQCQRGQCTASPDGSKAYCQCDPGFIGPRCSIALPTWLSWSEWDQSECTPICGAVRIKVRVRKCGSRIYYKGYFLECQGDSRQERRCAVKYCRVNGKWNDWGGWSRCSRRCGNGVKRRRRACFYATEYDHDDLFGENCPGKGTERARCNTFRCAPNQITEEFLEPPYYPPDISGYLDWSSWSNCNVYDCGSGRRVRIRRCKFGARLCKGENFEIDNCFKKCPTNEKSYDEWNEWSSCNNKEIYCTRNRQCSYESCFGRTTQTAKCVTKKDESSNYKRVCRGEIMDHPTWLVGKMMGTHWLKIFIDFNKELNDSFVLDWEDDLIQTARLLPEKTTAKDLLKNIIVITLIIVSTYTILASSFFILLFIFIRRYLKDVLFDLENKTENFTAIDEDDDDENTRLLT
ncbi:DgyrCDS6661 [Dimorphilus gyrociliatus]|uniref:DgyrCDS6661 n=1 Tax=Dimorphilus gyrociliatus TaxID=2664684 RepID=A0A7I8VPB9_9ANNE|nr:DgyrCDS6661 [Dimorphilus gyrociliatus]